MRIVSNFVSLLAMVCILYLTFIRFSADVDVNISVPLVEVYPTKVRSTIYIDRQFSEKEKQYIMEAASEWENVTQGIVQYQIVELPTFRTIDFQSCLFIIKITPDDPEILLMDSQDTTVGFYTTKSGIPTISLIEDAIEDKFYKSVVMHEIGHSLGLKHQSEIDDMGTLMYPYLKIKIGDYFIEVNSNDITKTDLAQFCSLYRCNVDQLME